MIYLDNAATTRTRSEVVREMLPWFDENYGNPSSVYRFGGKAKEAVAVARKQVAAVIGARDDEIFFTSGGSESDNWALREVFEGYAEKGDHIITTKVEHPAIRRTCEYLERFCSAKITYLDVDAYGMVDPRSVEAAITPETILISVMTANNEVGTIQPIREIGAIAHSHDILFHTDAVQAFGHIPISVEDAHIDLLSASGHKFHGPKGIGMLYVRRGVKLPSLLHGGAQEKNRRAGTENVPGIVGMGKAAEMAAQRMQENAEKITKLRDFLIERIEQEIPLAHLNGHRTNRLPNNVNFSFEFVQGESLLIMLDRAGICASSGSACSSGSLEPSHVLRAMGVSDLLAHGALRMTLSEENTEEELKEVVETLKKNIERLRSMSTLYTEYCERKNL